MKRIHLRRISISCAVLVLAAGCGGSSKEATPARTPASQPASGAPAEEESSKEAPAADQSVAPAAPAPAAGSAFPGSTRKGEARGEGAADDIEALGKRLEGALSLSVPDCTTAWSLRDRICDLADRICDLAGRSAERDIAERCTDGKARCERATSRVRESCGR